MKVLRPKLELTLFIYIPLSIVALLFLFFRPEWIKYSLHFLHFCSILLLLLAAFFFQKSKKISVQSKTTFIKNIFLIFLIQFMTVFFFLCFNFSIHSFFSAQSKTVDLISLKDNFWGIYTLLGLLLATQAPLLKRAPIATICLKPVTSLFKKESLKNIVLWSAHFYITQNNFFWLTINLSVFTLFITSKVATILHLPFFFGTTFFNIFLSCAMVIAVSSTAWIKTLRTFGHQHAIIRPMSITIFGMIAGILILLIVVSPIQYALTEQTIKQQWLIDRLKDFNSNPHYINILLTLWWLSVTPIIARFYAKYFVDMPILFSLIVSSVLPITFQCGLWFSQKTNILVTFDHYTHLFILIPLVGLLFLFFLREFQSLFITRISYVLEKNKTWFLPLRGLTQTFSISAITLLMIGNLGLLLLFGMAFFPFFLTLVLTFVSFVLGFKPHEKI